MRLPHGHFNLDGMLTAMALAFFPPIFGVAGIVTLSILKIWFNFNWAWLAVPASILIAWLLWLKMKESE